MSEDVNAELIRLSKRLLASIDSRDWETYAALCDPALTAFEPEGAGHLVKGMDFHRFYFELEGRRWPRQSSLSSPVVRVVGDVALVTYVRLVQRVEEDARPATVAFEETRVWQRQSGGWKHIHFHRSPAGHVQST